MFFRRRIELLERDIGIETKTKEIDKLKIHFTDMLDDSPYFDYMNYNISEFTNSIIDTNDIYSNLERNVDFNNNLKVKNNLNIEAYLDCVDFNFKTESLKIAFLNDTIINKIDFSIVEPNKKQLDFKKPKIKYLSPEKKIVKNIIKQLKRQISKEYIIQLAREVEEEENISIKNLSVNGFLKEVPVGNNLVYSWEKNKFLINRINKIETYYDAVVFISKINKNRIIKFIKR